MKLGPWWLSVKWVQRIKGTMEGGAEHNTSELLPALQVRKTEKDAAIWRKWKSC